jgi:hypothetical protein
MKNQKSENSFIMKQFNSLRKLSSIVIMLLLFALNSWGQSLTDQEAVLKECINIPEIQQQLPKDAEGNLKTVYIMQNAISSPDQIDITLSGKKVQFMTKGQMYNHGPDAFFRFEKLDITDKQAKVIFGFEYNRNQPDQRGQMFIRGSLKKQDSDWAIVNTNIHRR